MATLVDIENSVKEQKTLVEGLSSLIDGLKQQVKDAMEGAVIPPETQARIDGVFAELEENKAKMSAALVANTQPEPKVSP